VFDSPSFLIKDMTAETIQRLFLETCKETCASEIKKQKEKKQESVSAASQAAQPFETTLKPQECPTLVSKNISLTSNQDLMPVLRKIVKLSKQVESVDILKILNLNDSTTSLVEELRLPEAGPKDEVGALCPGECKKTQNDDNKIACADSNAAGWLLTHLGEIGPGEFVKSAQAPDMPVHPRKMDTACAAAMWSDAGVGVAAQGIVMKHLMSFFGCKFAVPEAAMNKLAVHSAPQIVGRTECMDRMLDHWHKDLVHLLAAQIASKHESQPPEFSHATVDFVVGADHGQGSFCASSVKVTHREADRSVAAAVVCGLGEIECGKDAGDLLALTFTPKSNAALKRIVERQRDENGWLVSDGMLAVCQRAEGSAGQEEAERELSFCAILDRTGQRDVNDTLVFNVPIGVFITGDLAFCATVAVKEGMVQAQKCRMAGMCSFKGA
jgi:hypothetical protein